MIAIRQTQDLTFAGPMLEKALAYDTGGNHGQLADMIGGCAVFELMDGAEVVGAFAAQVHQYSDGRQITVTAAGGLPGYDLVGVMDAWLTLQAAGPVGATALTCTTRRKGLIKRLQRAGYQVAGYVLRKEVKYGLA